MVVDAANNNDDKEDNCYDAIVDPVITAISRKTTTITTSKGIKPENAIDFQEIQGFIFVI